MPEFRVRFLTPVIYQAGHYKAEQRLSELIVRAPDATAAVTHAVRVVQGDVGGMTVEPYSPPEVLQPVEVS